MNGITDRSRALGEFELLLLCAVLHLGEGAYGADVQREIEKRTGRSPMSGAIYTGLERLQARGLLSSRVGDPTPERGGRRKRYFRLEPLGLRSLTASLERIRRMSEGALPRIASIEGTGGEE